MGAWEMFDGESQKGPLTEGEVILAIADGLAPTTLVRRTGELEWLGLRSYAPFALALERRSATPAGSTAASRAPVVQPWQIGAAVAVAAVIVACIAALAGKSSGSVSDVVADPGAPREAQVDKAAATADAPPPVPKVNPVAEIQAKLTLADAVAYARPVMVDRFNASSPGTLLLTVWALKMMTWEDVAVAVDETSHALVQKDADAERGKRLCARGTIIQIEAQKDAMGTFYSGLLMSGSGKLYNYHAVGSSGDLVAHSPARLCGVVTGLYAYSNSGGGTGHAVDMVGMFDLPANRPKK